MPDIRGQATDDDRAEIRGTLMVMRQIADLIAGKLRDGPLGVVSDMEKVANGIKQKASAAVRSKVKGMVTRSGKLADKSGVPLPDPTQLSGAFAAGRGAVTADDAPRGAYGQCCLWTLYTYIPNTRQRGVDFACDYITYEIQWNAWGGKASYATAAEAQAALVQYDAYGTYPPGISDPKQWFIDCMNPPITVPPPPPGPPIGGSGCSPDGPIIGNIKDCISGTYASGTQPPGTYASYRVTLHDGTICYTPSLPYTGPDGTVYKSGDSAWVRDDPQYPSVYVQVPVSSPPLAGGCQCIIAWQRAIKCPSAGGGPPPPPPPPPIPIPTPIPIPQPPPVVGPPPPDGCCPTVTCPTPTITFAPVVNVTVEGQVCSISVTEPPPPPPPPPPKPPPGPPSPKPPPVPRPPPKPNTPSNPEMPVSWNQPASYLFGNNAAAYREQLWYFLGIQDVVHVDTIDQLVSYVDDQIARIAADEPVAEQEIPEHIL